jgi:hypothetical protein
MGGSGQMLVFNGFSKKDTSTCVYGCFLEINKGKNINMHTMYAKN